MPTPVSNQGTPQPHVPKIAVIEDDNNYNDHEKIDAEEQFLPNTTIVTHCIYTNDISRLSRCFEDATDPFKETFKELINQRDDAGKSPLDLAACLGITELANLLIKNGVDINSITSKGYNCLHHAAAWGQIQVLQILVQNGVHLLQQNIHCETPRDIALRYGQNECADYLEIAEEKKKLQEEINHTLGKFQEMDKAMASKITKDEKNLVINTCKGKQEWLNTTSAASALDVRSQHSELVDIAHPVLSKLSETL